MIRLKSCILVILMFSNLIACHTYYDILQVDKSSSSDEIDKAYNQKLKIYKEELYVYDEKFKESLQLLETAYKVLSNPDLRCEYDRSLSINQDVMNVKWFGSYFKICIFILATIGGYCFLSGYIQRILFPKVDSPVFNEEKESPVLKSNKSINYKKRTTIDLPATQKSISPKSTKVKKKIMKKSSLDKEILPVVEIKFTPKKLTVDLDYHKLIENVSPVYKLKSMVKEGAIKETEKHKLNEKNDSFKKDKEESNLSSSLMSKFNEIIENIREKGKQEWKEYIEKINKEEEEKQKRKLEEEKRKRDEERRIEEEKRKKEEELRLKEEENKRIEEEKRIQKEKEEEEERKKKEEEKKNQEEAQRKTLENKDQIVEVDGKTDGDPIVNIDEFINQIISHKHWKISERGIEHYKKVLKIVNPQLIKHWKDKYSTLEDIKENISTIHLRCNQITPVREKLKIIITTFKDLLSNNPQYQKYLKFIMAEKLINSTNQADSDANILSVAHVIVSLSVDHLDFMAFFIYIISEKCPYIIPMYPIKAEGQDHNDFKINDLKYNVNKLKKTVEEEDRYLKRIESYIKLYSNVTVIERDILTYKDNPYGIEYAWRWITRLLNLGIHDQTPYLLKSFLSRCAYYMKKKYQNQWLKIHNLILELDDKDSSMMKIVKTILQNSETYEVPPKDSKIK